MLDNQFTCSNGHVFRANAKIRARCTECGTTARRDFKVAAPKVDEPKVDELKVDEPKVEPKPPTVLKPVLLKQGRPRVMATKPPAKTPAVSKPKRPVKSSLIGKAKVSSGLVKSTRIKTRGTMPAITGKPIKTAPARTIKSAGNPRSSRPFWHDVADKYGIGR